MILKENLLKSAFSFLHLASILISIVISQLVLGTVILATESNATSGEAAPFGLSGVRYPNEFTKSNPKSPVSIRTQDTNTSWVRGSTLVWGHLETSKGHYNWRHFDAVIQQCQADNIYILINVAPFATWDQGSKRGKPNDMTAFLVFLKKLVERYDFDGVDDMPGLQYGMHYFEILNEPMAVGHFFDGDVQDFFEIYKQSYPIIKQASAKAKLLLAGLADIEDKGIRGLPPMFSAHPLTKQYIKTFHTYYDLLHEMNIERYYDIMNLHIYDSNLTTVISYYQKFDKPIWITETSESNQNGATAQSQMLIKRFIKALALGVDKIFWFSLTNDQHMLHSGLFDHNQKPRKTFFAYRMLVDKLKDIQWNKIHKVPTSEAKVHCYAFPKTNNNGTIWVAWTEQGTLETQLNLHIQSATATLTHLQIPKAIQEKEVNLYHFISQSIPTTKGDVQITLNINPTFIETGNPPPYSIAVTSLQGKSRKSLKNGPSRKQQGNRSSLQSPSGRNPASSNHQPHKGPLFGKIKTINGNKITFTSPQTQDIVVYTDKDTTITQNRYDPIDLKYFSPGDDVVIILRQPNATTEKQMLIIMDKLPSRRR